MGLFGRKNQQSNSGGGQRGWMPEPTKPDPACSHEAYSAVPNDEGEWHVMCSLCGGEWLQPRK